jgi:membrane protein implicated in regulation of membrane protease activity
VRSLLVYTLSRLGLFAVAFGVLYLIGLHDWFWLLVAAVLVSGVASYVLLSKQRDDVSQQISKLSRRPDDDQRPEDQ